MPDAPHIIADRYELTTPLLRGGMGVVWRGFDRRLDRPIAVKLIRPDIAVGTDEHDELVARFRREAKVTAKIECPGVPAVFDADFDDDAERLYLVMQYLPGCDLTDLIAEVERLPLGWAVSIAGQIATVLSHAHAVPVVHRDLKPGNIRLGEDGRVWVLDFGIAAVTATDVTRLTSTGSLIGTSAYMAPEQVMAGQLTPRTDLYALGCLLHEMLTGRRVFESDSPFELMRAHLETAPEPVTALREDVPAEIETLVLDLLAKQAADRPDSAAVVAKRLRPFLPGMGSRTESRAPNGFGDPTTPYRFPLAARPPDRGDTVERGVAPPRGVGSDELQAAVDAAMNLMEADRFTQAGDGLAAVLPAAATGLGRRHPDVLAARRLRAVALFLGQDYREALPEFETLASIYASQHGALDPDSLLCRKQAAYCRASLGQLDEALSAFGALLPDLAAAGAEMLGESFEARKTVAQLHEAAGDHEQARTRLEALHVDLVAAHGPDDPDVRAVAALLTRWRAATPEPVHMDQWRRVSAEVVDDPAIGELVAALTSRDAPPPEVGFELGDGAWLAELAWPGRKVAVLLDDVGTDAEGAYRKAGWRAHSASAWTADGLSELLRGEP